MEELCEQAFTSWNILMTSLDDVEIEPLIDQSLSIIIKNWNTFQSETRIRALNLVRHIFENHSRLVRNTVDTMPSLSSIPIMAEFEMQISTLKGKMDVPSQFMAFCRRCQNENPVVVEQALKE